MKDRFELEVSTSSSQALEAYVEAVDISFALQLGAGEKLDEALTHDPDFALAHAARARIHQSESNVDAARLSIARARELAVHTSPRERGHVEIIGLTIDGRGADALDLIDEHAGPYPTDALPLSSAMGVYGLIAFSGIVDHHERQLALLERLAPHWPEDWWFLAAYGWARIETGDLCAGIDLVERALVLNPDSANAAHARAHGYYELGDAEAGLTFTTDWLVNYDPHCMLHCHLAWHRALFALQLGDADTALAVYRAHIAPAVTHCIAMFTMIDATAFAWRAALHGSALTGDELREIGDFAMRHFPNPGIAFVNMHNCLALTLSGKADARTP